MKTSYLDHTSTGACCNNGGGGADVESVVCVPASADNVDDIVLVRVEYDSGHGARKEKRGCGNDDFFS